MRPAACSLAGGTHNPMAPPFHFLSGLCAAGAPLGADLQMVLRRCGFYPAGGGEVEATIVPGRGGCSPST